MTFQSCVAKDHWWAYSSCQFARHLRITPRRNTITREQPPSLRDPHKEFSQPINPWSFNLLNWLVCVCFIYRANCLYKENSTHITVIVFSIVNYSKDLLWYHRKWAEFQHTNIWVGKCIYLLFLWLAVSGFRQNYFYILPNFGDFGAKMPFSSLYNQPKTKWFYKTLPPPCTKKVLISEMCIYIKSYLCKLGLGTGGGGGWSDVS